MKIYLDDNALMPRRAHPTDAGLDLLSPIDVVVRHGSYAIIDTGVHIELPHGYYGSLQSKSGLNINRHLTTTGTVDEGYTGSIKVKIYNHGEHYLDDYRINRGDKITQLVIQPYIAPELELVGIEEFAESDRGDKGFGSSGR